MTDHVLTDAKRHTIRNATISAAHVLGAEGGVVAAVEQVLAAQFPDAPRASIRLDGHDREALLEAFRHWRANSAAEDLFRVVSEVVAAKRQTLLYRG